MQNGFDGGFPVGAQLGMRAGTVLGILEGISRGLEERGGAGVAKKPGVRASASGSSTAPTETPGAEARVRAREQVRRVYEDAVKALDVQSVFAGFEAGPVAQPPMGEGDMARREEGKDKEAAEKQLGRKGDAVIAKWEEKVSVPRWEVNMEALEMREQGKEEEGKGERS